MPFLPSHKHSFLYLCDAAFVIHLVIIYLMLNYTKEVKDYFNNSMRIPHHQASTSTDFHLQLLNYNLDNRKIIEWSSLKNQHLIFIQDNM